MQKKFAKTLTTAAVSAVLITGSICITGCAHTEANSAEKLAETVPNTTPPSPAELRTKMESVKPSDEAKYGLYVWGTLDDDTKSFETASSADVIANASHEMTNTKQPGLQIVHETYADLSNGTKQTWSREARTIVNDNNETISTDDIEWHVDDQASSIDWKQIAEAIQAVPIPDTATVENDGGGWAVQINDDTAMRYADLICDASTDPETSHSVMNIEHQSVSAIVLIDESGLVTSVNVVVIPNGESNMQSVANYATSKLDEGARDYVNAPDHVRSSQSSTDTSNETTSETSD